MGWQYLQLDRPDRAEAVFRRGLAVNPRNLLMNGHLVEALLRLGRPEEAVRQAEATLALKPDDGEFMVKMARALAALGRKKKEESFLRVGGFEERGRAGPPATGSKRRPGRDTRGISPPTPCSGRSSRATTNSKSSSRRTDGRRRACASAWPARGRGGH